MTVKTIKTVFDGIDESTTQHGTFYYVNVMFADESLGSVGSTDKARAEERRARLAELVGKAVDFELESKPKTKTGREAWKIKSWEGAPGTQHVATGQPSSNGGRSASKFDADEQRSIDARKALEEAVKLAQANGVGDVDWVVETITRFFAAMQKCKQSPVADTRQEPAGQAPADAGEAVTPSASPVPSEERDTVLGILREKLGSDARITFRLKKAVGEATVEELWSLAEAVEKE